MNFSTFYSNKTLQFPRIDERKNVLRIKTKIFQSAFQIGGEEDPGHHNGAGRV